MKKISQILMLLVVSLMLVGCVTTTKLGPAGTLDAGFCIKEAPKYLGWLSCDKPLINLEADIISNGEADEEPSEAAILGKTRLFPMPADLKGELNYAEPLWWWATQNNSVSLVPNYAAPLLNRFVGKETESN